MNAVARLCWTYFTAFPIQRWLGVIAIGLLPLGTLARELTVLSMLGVAIFLFAVTLPAGWIFATLSAPRTHRLLPFFRQRMLAAIALVIALAALPWLVLVVLPAARGPSAALVGLSIGLYLPSMLVWMLHYRAAAVLGAGAICGVLYFGRELTVQSSAWVAPLGISVATAALLLNALLWLLFGVAYLRSTKPPWLCAPIFSVQPLDRQRQEPSGNLTRESAIVAYLSERYALRPNPRVTALGLLLLIAALAWLVTRASHVAETAGGYWAGIVVVAVFAMVPAANRTARRTRPLWLRSGSRRELFAAAEAEIWRTNLKNGAIGTALLVLVVAVLFDVPAQLLSLALVFAISSAVLAAYLGLMYVVGLRLLDACVGLLLLAAIGTGVWAIHDETVHYAALGWLVVLEVGATVLVRTVALRRWQRLDWLVFRPARVAFQGTRRTG